MATNDDDIGIRHLTPEGRPLIYVTPRRSGEGGEGAGGVGGDTPSDLPASALTGALLPPDKFPDPNETPPPPLPLPDDSGPMEGAIVRLADRRRVGEAQGFLAQHAAVSGAGAGAAGQPTAADTITGNVEVAQPDVAATLGGAAADIGRGITEAPLQVLGGIRDAVQSGIHLATWLGDNLPAGANGPLPLGLLGAAGEVDKTLGLALPDVKQPKTVTGGLVRGVAQFLTGFGAAGGVVKGAGAAAAMAKGALSDFSAFEGHDQRLADLIQQYPALQNPVTEFLASKPGEGEAEGRFKRALEGLGLGVLAEGFIRSIKFLRDAKRATASAKAAGVHGGEAPAPQPINNPLGNEAAPVLARQAEVEAGAAIDNTRDISSGANSGAKTGTVYVDKDIPEFSPKLTDGAGNPANLHKYLATHELREAELMTAGMGYKEAHIQATAAERAAVEADGVSWDGYTKEIDGYLAKIENKKIENPAPEKMHVDPEAAIGHHAADNKQIASGVPADVEARGVAGAAGDQRAISARAAPGSPEAAAYSDLRGMVPLGNGATYINFARINTADDVKRVLADIADAFKGDVDKARRGVRSHEQTAAAAYETDAWQTLMQRRAGAPLNAEQTLAARNLWEASGRKLIEVAEIAAREPSPDNLYAFRKMLALHQTVQREVLGARAETARALDAWKIDSRGGSGRTKAIAELLDAWGGDGVAEDLARRVAALKNQPDAAAALSKFVERGALAKTFGVAKEVWTNSLLWSPITHVKVIASNAINQAYDLVERAAAAGWSHMLGSGEVSAEEAAAKLYGQRAALRDAWRLAGRALKTGRSQFGAQMTAEAPHLAPALRGAGAMKYHDNFLKEISSDNFKLASGGWRDPRNWLGNAVDGLGTAVNFPSHTVGAQDDFFKMIGYRGELAARAVRKATEEVRAGTITKQQMPDRVQDLVDHPPDDIRLAAVDHARYLNFTDEPGKWVKAVNRWEAEGAASNHLGGQVGALMLRMLMPFRTTPSRITWAAVERSPLAPLMKRYQDAVAKGGAEADIARTRMALGTMAMLSLVDLGLDGHITGGGPQGEHNRAERQTLMRSGWQPYSVRVPTADGKARYFSFNQLDPFGMHMGMAADFAEILNNAQHFDRQRQEELLDIASSMGFSFAKNILSKTWMTGVAEAQEAANRPDSAGHFVRQQLASYIPNASRWARRLTDPQVRWAADSVGEMKNRIPGLSENLPPARDFWGRPRSYQSGLGTLYDAVMPMQSKLYNPEPVDKAALDNGFGFATQPVKLGAFTLSPNHHPELYSRYLEIRGQLKPSEMPAAEKPRGAAALEDLRAHQMAGPELLIHKYGNVPLLDLVNGVVAGNSPNDELNKAYAAAPDGPARERIVKRIVADYGRAARGSIIYESAAAADAVRKKAAR